MNASNAVVSSLRAFVITLGAAAIAAVAACSSDASSPGDGASCKAGTTVTCACADGSTGSQQCGAASCTCNGTHDASTGGGNDAGAEPDTSTGAQTDSGAGNGDGGHLHDGGGPGADASPGSYGADCTKDTDCTDPVYNACFLGGSRSFCTKHCTGAADCPNPPTSGTCNKQSFCK